MIRKLRHRGKTRHTKDHVENRGKIPISHTIHEKPKKQTSELESVIGKQTRLQGKLEKLI